MQVAMVPIDGVYMRAIVVTDHSPSKSCENCGKPSYYHPLLATEDPDWCLRCNDEHYRGHMTDEELGVWTAEQMKKGKAIAVVFDSQGIKKTSKLTENNKPYFRTSRRWKI